MSLAYALDDEPSLYSVCSAKAFDAAEHEGWMAGTSMRLTNRLIRNPHPRGTQLWRAWESGKDRALEE
jgi:hypothetical protein